MKLQAKLLTAALAAYSLLEFTNAITTSAEDIAQFPEFEATVQQCVPFQWQSYPVTTPEGYNIVMFRVTGDAAGVPFAATKGPVLLMHGAFSDSVNWITCQDTSLPPVAVQLAQQGYDVWIASGRGRRFSRTHVSLNADDPADAPAYWYYSFEDVGIDEIPALT